MPETTIIDGIEFETEGHPKVMQALRELWDEMDDDARRRVRQCAASQAHVGNLIGLRETATVGILAQCMISQILDDKLRAMRSN